MTPHPDRPQVGDVVRMDGTLIDGVVVATFYDNFNGMSPGRWIHVQCAHGVSMATCDRVTIVKRKGDQ